MLFDSQLRCGPYFISDLPAEKITADFDDDATLTVDLSCISAEL